MPANKQACSVNTRCTRRNLGQSLASHRVKSDVNRSFQRQKRKRRERQTRTRVQNEPEGLHSPGSASHNGDGPEGPLSLPDAEGSPPTANLEEQRSPHLRSTNESRINMSNLSFILHPSHEAATTENDPSARSAEHNEQQLLVDRSCDALGHSRDFVEDMQVVLVFFSDLSVAYSEGAIGSTGLG
ncbi:unnamed protein product, partial [Clonostachys solani]